MTFAPLSTSQRNALEDGTSQYVRDLQDDEEALEYLETERGLSRTVIGVLRLGVVRNIVDPSHSRFRGMICIPNISGHDDRHVTGLKFRSLNKDVKKKYDQPDNQVARLYNLAALRYAVDTIYVTEGEFDAICLEDVGLPAIAVPGVNHWAKSPYRKRLLEGLNVVLCRDSDEAALQLVKAMNDIDGLVVRDPAPYKDVNEMYLAEGADALLAWAEGRTA